MTNWGIGYDCREAQIGTDSVRDDLGLDHPALAEGWPANILSRCIFHDFITAEVGTVLLLGQEGA